MATKEEQDANAESVIDGSMYSAALRYERLNEQGHPYAMHKAVESISTAVLLEILGRRAKWELSTCLPTIDTIKNKGVDQ